MTSDWKELALGDITELVIDYRGKTPKKLGEIGVKRDIRLYPQRILRPGGSFNQIRSGMLTKKCIGSG